MKNKSRITFRKFAPIRFLTLCVVLIAPQDISNSLAQSTGDRPTQIVLPGGATSLNETHGDWTVSCGKNQLQIMNCLMSQQLLNAENKQRVMAIELTIANGPAAGLNGTMVLPFGVKLSDGVKLAVDENSLLTEMPFSTCLPLGCVASIQLNPKMVEAFRVGSIVSIVLNTLEDTQLKVELSLKGFSSAHNRITALKG